MFNWLGSSGIVGLDCLDLYAGSGAFGFEALSRGARSVVFVEQDRRLTGALEAHAMLLGAHGAVVWRGDAVAFLSGSDLPARARAAAAQRAVATSPDVADASGVAGRTDGFGLIFLDPPYTTALDPLLDPALDHLTGDGLIYLERPAVEGLPERHSLRWYRQGRAGRIVFGLAGAA